MAQKFDISEFHWLMDMLQTIDVGLVVLDRDYNIRAWNSFMENHSGMKPQEVREKSIFDCFTEIPRLWFTHKTQAVFLLKSRSFTTWEQRPYLFKFKNYRPITGTEEFMYQNITISPLVSTTGEVGHICIIIYDVTDIASNRKQLETANAKLEKLSRTDKLTQLNNRGYWEEQLVREFMRFHRTAGISSLIMFDIDHFKKVNDTYGHQAGDEVIIMVSNTLQDTMRVTDIAGRYGGEEFGVILVDTPRDKALIFAERLREAIKGKTVTHDKATINITISLGVSEINENIPDHKAWLEQADSALYQSKEGGRNRVTVWREE
jgi:diguanylate cyclase